MSDHTPAAQTNQETPAEGSMDEVMGLLPLVLPLAGGVLIFLLAFIAVTLA